MAVIMAELAGISAHREARCLARPADLRLVAIDILEMWLAGDGEPAGLRDFVAGYVIGAGRDARPGQPGAVWRDRLRGLR